jgi:hypothetical protein
VKKLCTCGVLGQAFSIITFTHTGIPLLGLRAIVKRQSDPESVTYCADIATGQAIPFTSFTRTCWDATNPGIALTPADVPTIQKIDVYVRSTTTPIVVDNPCLTKIEFDG